MKLETRILKLDENTSVEIALVSAPKIQALNRIHRGIDKPTDILSFPLYSYDELAESDWRLAAPKEPLLLGTLVLCKDIIRKRAKEEGADCDQRLCWTIEHGLRHLLGYEHDASGQNWTPARHEKFIQTNHESSR